MSWPLLLGVRHDFLRPQHGVPCHTLKVRMKDVKRLEDGGPGKPPKIWS